MPADWHLCLRGGVTWRLCQSTIDFSTHDLAVCRRVVIPAKQCAGKVVTGLLQCGDLVVQSFESLPGDGLPLGNARCFEDSGDVV